MRQQLFFDEEKAIFRGSLLEGAWLTRGSKRDHDPDEIQYNWPAGMTGTDERKTAIGSDASSAPMSTLWFSQCDNELAHCKRYGWFLKVSRQVSKLSFST